MYCNANPVKNIDADGNIPTAVVGAIIGATVNATIAAIEGKSGSEIMAAAAGGAVSGAIIGSGGFLLGSVSSVAGDVVEQGLNIVAGTSYEYDAEGTIIAAISGAAFGKIGKEANDIIKSTGEVAIKSIESRFSNNRIFNKVLNEVKSDFKSAGKPTQGHAARSQMNTEAKSRLKSEKSFQIGASKIKTKLKEYGVDVSTGTSETLINHKLSTLKDE